MKLNIDHIRELFTAMSTGIAVAHLPYVSPAFRDLVFKTKVEQSHDFIGTLRSIRVFQKGVSILGNESGDFLAEMWYYDGRAGGVREASFPLAYVLEENDLTENSIQRMDHFFVYDKGGLIETGAVLGKHTAYSNASATHVPNIGFGCPPKPVLFQQPGMCPPPGLFQSPGGPYYQQPVVFPGPHQQMPRMDQVPNQMPSFNDTQERIKNQARTEFINRANQAQLEVLAPYSELIDMIKQCVNQIMSSPSMFEINSDGSIQRVSRIIHSIAAPALLAVQRVISKLYRDTGVSVRVTHAGSDQNEVSVTIRIS